MIWFRGDFALRTMSSLHWTLDLEKALANLIGQSITTLVKGATATDDETQLRKWLDSKLLSGGIDDAPTGLELRRKEFLEELIALPSEGESEAVILATYMHRHITAKKPLAALGGELGTTCSRFCWNGVLVDAGVVVNYYYYWLTTWLKNAVAKVERAAVAVLLKHNQLINEAMTFALWLTNNPSALEVADKAPLPPSLQMVWEVAYEVRSWLVQQQHKRRLAQKEGDAEIRYSLPTTSWVTNLSFPL
jgi:hypothetical protein